MKKIENNKSFGVLFFVVFLLIAIWPVIGDESLRVWSAVISLLFLLLGITNSKVLTPLKTLFEYDAINITLGLPFLRISPDHGPNEKMVGKNLSNPSSLINALTFLDKN